MMEKLILTILKILSFNTFSKHWIIVFIAWMIIPVAATSQDTIYLKNPSFEDVPRKGGGVPMAIREWTDCGDINFLNQSPPDIHPTRDSAWGITLHAIDGLTYLGLVTRYDDTYESVSQPLSKALQSGKCYKLSGYVALSERYMSATRKSASGGTPVIRKGKKRKEVSWSYWLTHNNDNMVIEGNEPDLENFSQPVEFLIWGGYDDCQRNQLYVHSGLIHQHEWTPFTLEFSPLGNHDHITLGAFFGYGYTEPYNGHLLLDALSPIIEIPCDK